MNNQNPMQHDSQPTQPDPELVRVHERFEIPAEELDTAKLLSATLKASISQIRKALEGHIVVDEKHRGEEGTSFSRRYDVAKAEINGMDIAYSDLVWSEFNDPHTYISLRTGDSVFSFWQGEDMNTGEKTSSISRHQGVNEDQWKLNLSGPYQHGAWLDTERQPGELGGPDATADEQMVAAILAIDDMMRGI
jgi:hypothetical protein